MKRIIAVLVTVLIGIAAFAQADTLYLSDIYTTHIRYGTEVIYVDISSPGTVLCKQLDQNKNFLAVRAAVPFKETSSVTVIEANEKIHTYIVAYCQSPRSLVIEGDRKPEVPVEIGLGAGVTAGAASKQPAPKNGGARPAPAAAPAGVSPSKNLTLSEALGLKRELYHLYEEKYDVTVSCDNVLIGKDQIFFVITLTNNSGVAYNCPDASFVIEPKTKKSRYLSNDRIIYHKSSSGSLSCEPGKSAKVAYSFDVFTIIKDQYLKIYINEIDGQRELCLTLNHTDINKARVL